MKAIRLLSLLLALSCALTLAAPALAAEVDCEATYCFTQQDFSEEELSGICITALPQAQTGTVMLGSRVLRPGDILTAQQVAQMTFSPLKTEEDQGAQMDFLAIYEIRVEPAAGLTLSIRGKEDKAPVAQDSALETYKNLPGEGKLLANDPEEQALT